MNKNLLIKYIRGYCSAEETGQVLEWIGQGEENAKYFSRLMNLWVSQNMPQEEASGEELAEIRSVIGKRYSVPAKKKGLYIPRTAAWIGAACLLLVAGLGVWAILREAPEETIADFSPEKYEAFRMFYTDKGVKGSIVLPDSSVVWLNSGSRLWYPDSFGAGRREVALSGEGYFEVKHDPERPMTVTTPKNFRVEVLGTTFNLKSYEDDDASVATLYSGSVNIIMDGAGKDGVQVRHLQPNEAITIYGNNSTSLAGIDTPGKNSGWKDGRINFEATPVREAVKILERWHGVEFNADNSEVLDYRITADFESESIVQIMDLIRMTSFIDYRIEGKKVFLKKR